LEIPDPRYTHPNRSQGPVILRALILLNSDGPSQQEPPETEFPPAAVGVQVLFQWKDDVWGVKP